MDIVTGGFGLPTGKQDLRVVKTRRNIEETFLRLLRDEPFERITVKQIVEEALINKGTFYRHYLDKYDLAEQVARRLAGELRGGIRGRVAKASGGIPLADLTAQVLESDMGLMGPLAALPGVEVDGVPAPELPRRVLAEEAGRAFQAAGGEAGDAEAWVASSLALSYVEYARQAADAVDIGAFLRIVRDASGRMLDYYGAAG